MTVERWQRLSGIVVVVAVVVVVWSRVCVGVVLKRQCPFVKGLEKRENTNRRKQVKVSNKGDTDTETSQGLFKELFIVL